MQLFDIRSDRQIIALAIKAFRIRKERRNYLKKQPQHTHPGLSLEEAFVYACPTVFLHPEHGEITQPPKAVNREARDMQCLGQQPPLADSGSLRRGHRCLELAAAGSSLAHQKGGCGHLLGTTHPWPHLVLNVPFGAGRGRPIRVPLSFPLLPMGLDPPTSSGPTKKLQSVSLQ